MGRKEQGPISREIKLPPNSLVRRLETIAVTPEGLREENHAPAVKEALVAWKRRVKTAKKTCGDARVLVEPNSTAVINDLAASGPHEPYEPVFNYRGVNAGGAVGHYDGAKLSEAHHPKGCGAADEKEKAEQKGDNGNDNGLEGYIERLTSSDSGILSIVSAREIARRTDRPVMAALQDHRTGITKAIYLYNYRGKLRYAEKPDIWNMIEHKAPLSEIRHYLYETGSIPEIDPEALTTYAPELASFLEQHNQYAADLRTQYPDYPEAMRDQNPTTLAISTDVRPIGLKFPKTFGVPGSVFNLRVPRDEIDGTMIVNPKRFNVVLDQAAYPITNFNRLHTIFIETGMFEISERLAEDLLKRDYMQEWSQKPGNQILVAQSTQGIVERLESYQAA